MQTLRLGTHLQRSLGWRHCRTITLISGGRRDKISRLPSLSRELELFPASRSLMRALTRDLAPSARLGLW